MFCSVEDCSRDVYARGSCQMHYRRWQRHGTTERLVEPGLKTCSVEGCDNVSEAKGLCHGHYLRLIRTGDIKEGDPLSRTKNTGTCEIEGCERPQNRRRLCKAHYTRLMKFGDVRADQPVATRDGSGGLTHGYWKVPVPMELRHLTNGETPIVEHRLVMAVHLGRPLFPDESVHHRNGDRLDNRIENLELWSRWQPSGQRVENKIAFAREILERYTEDP